MSFVSAKVNLSIILPKVYNISLSENISFPNYDQQRRFIISVLQKLLEICPNSIYKYLQIMIKLEISFSVRPPFVYEMFVLTFCTVASKQTWWPQYLCHMKGTQNNISWKLYKNHKVHPPQIRHFCHKRQILGESIDIRNLQLLDYSKSFLVHW